MKRPLPILVSLLILGAIYWRVDIRQVWSVLRAADPVWMAAAIALLVPLVWIAAMRLCRMVPRNAPISTGEATRLNLAAAALNMVLPSKMGDLAKSWFFRQRGHLSGSLALALVVFERTCDMLSLLAWCAFGLLFLPAKDETVTVLTGVILAGIIGGALLLGVRGLAHGALNALGRFLPARFEERIANLREGWEVMHNYFWADKRRLATIIGLSIGLWFVNLYEVWLFLRALGASVPVIDSLALTPLSLLAGLLPLTFAGVGTRDAAAIFVYRDYLTPETGAALGLVLTFRYVLVGLAGLPFLGLVSRAAPQKPD